MTVSRRGFLQLAAGSALAAKLPSATSHPLLRVPRYDQVQVLGGIGREQQANAEAVLATLDDDALLKPFRAMGNQPAPGRDIGGWYQYLPDYNWHTGDAGLAPGHCFGQWTSAMARFAASRNDATGRERVLRLQQLFAEAITPDFFDITRYPAYTLDKLNVGLLDSANLLQAPTALAIANKVRDCALPSLPSSALERDIVWRKDRDFSYTWDESYTLPENLFLLYTAGAGSVYRQMAQNFLLDRFFRPLAQGRNVLGKLHGYSHLNALGSAVQAYLVEGSTMHLQAAVNGYRMVNAQTFATGGWAPDELFEAPGSGKLLASLTDSHNSFETPCGTYALLKLSRTLLQISHDGYYGDCMERVIFNSMFGALPLQPDGQTYYYADLNQSAKRVYSAHRWPCCAGTYTQVAADYGINSYLLDDGARPGVWVNLYLPSRISWQSGSVRAQLTQQTDYPLGERILLTLTLDRPAAFPLRLRLPAWCRSPSLLVNGRPQVLRPERGFTTLDRTWHDGDRLELHLPPTCRLESFPADGLPQPALAALCWGPLVLLPEQTGEVSQRLPETLTRTGVASWRSNQAAALGELRPIFAVGEARYSTYLRLST